MMHLDVASHMYIIMPAVIIVLGIGVISASIFITQHTESLLESDFSVAQMMLTDHIQERAFHLFEANLTIHNVARIIDSVLDKNLPSSAIENNVASYLFMALSVTRLASQISFVRVNGVVFSYIIERDQAWVVFANTSSELDNSTAHQWYTQKFDKHTGKQYGAVHAVAPIYPNDSLWFSDALKGMSRSTSYGYGWGYDRDKMFFFTAPVDRYTVIAFGIKLKDFIKYLLSTKLHDARAFVLTKDGLYFLNGNNTNTLKAINMSVSLPVNKIIGDSCDGIINAQLFARLSSTKHMMTKREKFMLMCAPIHLSQILLVVIVAFPVKNFMLLLQKMKVMIVLLLSFFILIVIIGSCISSKLFRRLQRHKVYALANLIKQKEATQQAERKSMNKSIAFASASHDVRASLAGITGLVKLCHDVVPLDSDVARNLVQMDYCASKLLGILNSVLDISKVEAGKMQLNDVEFNMAQAIEESADIFHVVALAKGLEVRLMGGDIGIKDKRPGERGSCFMFNIFMKSIDVSSNNTEEGFDSCKIPMLNRLYSFSAKTKSKVQSNMHAMAVSQGIVDGIQCLIIIRSAETRRILKDWMRSLGVMVSVAQQPEKMSVVLKKMTHNYCVSESDDPSLPSSGEDNEFSCSRDENNQVLPLGVKDVSKKASLKGSSKYLLVIFDLGFGSFSEMHDFLACLSKSTHYFHQYKIICLTDSTGSCSQISCDLMLYKPLHGSRFYKILGLMQEFREELKPEVAQVSNKTNELEKRTLLNSAFSQQNNFVVFKDENEKEPLKGMKILLAEDQYILRQIASTLLSRSGAIVIFVQNGFEALNSVKVALEERSHISEGSSRHLPFDFILMDCEMPIMDGYEATKCIRTEEKKYDIHIPIIALSAHAAPDEAEKTLLCGMDFHLTKPLEINKLLEAIKLISQY